MFSPEGDDFPENEGTAFGKSGGLFSGTGTLFDEVAEEEGESPRTNDLEASIRSNQSCEFVVMIINLKTIRLLNTPCSCLRVSCISYINCTSHYNTSHKLTLPISIN